MAKKTKAKAAPPTCSGVTVKRDTSTDRTLVAIWTWKYYKTVNKKKTEYSNSHYTSGFSVRWWYTTSLGVKILASESTVQIRSDNTSRTYNTTYSMPDNAVTVSFQVKPISKTYTVEEKDAKGKIVSKEVNYYTSSWSKEVVFKHAQQTVPTTPSAPSVEVVYRQNSKQYELLATVSDFPEDAEGGIVSWEFYQDDPTPKLIWSSKGTVTTRRCGSSAWIEVGHSYKVRCKLTKKLQKVNIDSDWSEFSQSIGTVPVASAGITVCKAKTSTSVYLEWAAVNNADSYVLEYTTDKSYFDGASSVSSSNPPYNHWEVTGLETGKEYFFRVAAKNSSGNSAWTPIVSVIIGKVPAAPTTWSSTTTAVVGEPMNLYWVHNSEDNSSQVSAQLELTINDVVQPIITIQNSTYEDEKDKTSVYSLNTSSYSEGSTIKWRVRTRGILDTYGDWSTQRIIYIYAKPTLAIGITDINGNTVETLNSFPFVITSSTGPATQIPIGFHISIVANSSYDTYDEIGNSTRVKAGDEIYSKNFDISEQLNVTFSANDVDLQNGISYSVICSAYMNSGLSAETTVTFTVGWSDDDDNTFTIDAEIGFNPSTYTVSILPQCFVYTDEEETEISLIEGVFLSVYRREFDGTFTEISKNLRNESNITVTDPHPSLDYARYRIVAMVESTGAIGFYDVPGYPIGCKSVIIQWDEEWSNFYTVTDGVVWEPPWSGSLLELPYNIDVSDNNDADVELAEYIGRKHPVSYYGTQLGSSATWSMEIDKNDKETLYALRRLSIWMGNVYVREPSGSGYWANVKVSFNQTHCKTTIPVTLNIRRVEGGV